MEAALAAKGITFVLLEGDPSEAVPAFAAACGAGLIVVDQSPLRMGREWRDAVAAAAACPVHEVDAHNVVPVWAGLLHHSIPGGGQIGLCVDRILAAID
jgi:deoxyribodipyrimidine photo-lyase